MHLSQYAAHVMDEMKIAKYITDLQKTRSDSMEQIDRDMIADTYENSNMLTCVLQRIMITHTVKNVHNQIADTGINLPKNMSPLEALLFAHKWAEEQCVEIRRITIVETEVNTTSYKHK
jgi:hypothetical protein